MEINIWIITGYPLILHLQMLVEIKTTLNLRKTLKVVKLTNKV